MAKLETYSTREDWLQARRRSIGSSDSAVLWGCGYASQSLYALWCDKLGLSSWQPSKAELRRLKKGQLLEPYIREIASEELGVELFTDPPNSMRVAGYLSASLDSYCVADERHIPVELKHVGPHNADEWNDDALPLKYEAQVRHQMLVVGAPYGYVCGLCDDELFVRRVERDAMFDAEHKRRCHAFWESVATKTPPTIDGSEATTEAIKARWRRERGPRVEVGAELDEWTRTLGELTERIKADEQSAESLKNKIRDAIGDAEGCISPSGVEWTWKTQERKEYVVAASSARILRRVGKRKGK